MVPDILADLQQSQTALNTALQEVSTGKSVTVPSDNPAASADMVQNTIETAECRPVHAKRQQRVVAWCRPPIRRSGFGGHVAHPGRFAWAPKGRTAPTTPHNLQAIATQVQGILQGVVSQANTSYQGSYLFGGTGPASDSLYRKFLVAFRIHIQRQQRFELGGRRRRHECPGQSSRAARSSRIKQRRSWLAEFAWYPLSKAATTTAIQTATSAVSAALNYVSQQRVFYGNAESQLNSQETSLQQETVSLTSQQSFAGGRGRGAGRNRPEPGRNRQQRSRSRCGKGSARHIAELSCAHAVGAACQFEDIHAQALVRRN